MIGAQRRKITPLGLQGQVTSLKDTTVFYIGHFWFPLCTIHLVRRPKWAFKKGTVASTEKVSDLQAFRTRRALVPSVGISRGLGYRWEGLGGINCVHKMQKALMRKYLEYVFQTPLKFTSNTPIQTASLIIVAIQEVKGPSPSSSC